MSPSNTVEVLYNDHHHWLTGWLRRKLGCPESAADLAQDTFMRVLAAREAPTLIEPRAFLTTVAKRVLFNFYRRQDLERALLHFHQPMHGLFGDLSGKTHRAK